MDEAVDSRKVLQPDEVEGVSGVASTEDEGREDLVDEGVLGPKNELIDICLVQDSCFWMMSLPASLESAAVGDQTEREYYVS